jgi:hypothetical protein
MSKPDVTPGISITFVKYDNKGDLIKTLILNIGSTDANVSPHELYNDFMSNPKKIAKGFGYTTAGYVVKHVEIIELPDTKEDKDKSKKSEEDDY